ncbi:MAG: Flp pilus assembly protein CpaB, partial [Planctomycetota bacterium]
MRLNRLNVGVVKKHIAQAKSIEEFIMGRVSSGTMTVAIVAILVGLGGAFVVRQHLHEPTVPPMPVLDVTDDDIVVPVALTDLEPGRVLSINDVALRRMSRDQFAKSKYAGLPFLRVTEQIANRTLRTALKQGDAFLPDLLYPEGMGPDLAERLQAGYRAVTVPIENIGAVQGFARSGSFVDVLFRVEPDEQSDRPEVTLTLLERVEVLAIDTFTQPGQQVQLEQDGSVTLAVSPHQAKILKVVEDRGALTLTLRNPDDQFEFVPFDLGMGEGLSQDHPQHSAVPARNISAREDLAVADSLNDALNSASERVTLEDLLGLPRRPRKVQMEIYLGSNLEVREFNEFSTSNTDVIRQGGRIQTPIAAQPTGRDDTSTVSTRTPRPFRADSA